MKIFETKADLVAASLTAGQLTSTKGYTAPGDGGGATYLIKTAVDYAGTPDEANDLTLANGNVAELIEGLLQANKTVTVPTDYSTITAALEDMYPKFKIPSDVTVTINLASGFTMNEQVLADGVDYSGYTLTSTDATVTITGSSMETDNVIVDGTSIYYSFAAENGGTLPTISVLFTVDGTGSLTPRVPLVITSGGRGVVTAGDGFQNAPTDAIRLDKGDLKARAAVFTGAGQYGAYLFNSSTMDAELSNFSGAGADGVLVTRGSIANLSQANVSGAAVNGLLATQGAIVNAGELNASGCGGAGIRARGGATVNANSANVSGCQDGIYADRNSNFSVDDDTVSLDASGNSRYSIFCRKGARVSGANINCGASRAFVELGGRLVAPGITISGAINSAAALTIESGGTALCNGGTFVNTGTGAAKGVYVVAGFFEGEGGTYQSDVNNAIAVSDGGIALAQNSTFTSDTGIMFFALGGRLEVARGTYNLNAAAFCDNYYGGYINISSPIAVNRSGSAPASSFICRDGGQINTHGHTEGSNVTVNTISTNGIVIR